MKQLKIKEGDFVLISASTTKKWMVKIEKDKEFHTHKGSIKHNDLIGREFGSSYINIKEAVFYLWKPIPYDYLDAISHSTQVIYQTDIAQILFVAGISSGIRVIEAGTGSGGLTSALAHYVRPSGKVYSYDIKEIHQQTAIKNLTKLGLDDVVEFKVKDAIEGFDESEVDAVILDLPQPWDVIEAAWNSLMGGGRLLVFVPTYVQVDKTIEKLVESNFYQIEAFEVIRRDLTTKIGAIRPVTRMVGFTAFLIVGRKGLSMKK
ncbi:MAG: tRNA (adenine-N1)-methyltransferase [Asgard group archaeon]|nr:tRNA (adenine-N1)-methyltransferase [Asgard group archaeon]